MVYKKIHGEEVSRLGFGSMRLPMVEKYGKMRVDDEKSVLLLRRAYEMGINYFDTAWTYCNEDGERALGYALKPFRSKVYLSTKLPMWNVKKPDDYWVYLEKALKNLDTDYIDFYHFHSVNKSFWDKIIEYKFLDFAQKAKAQGLIRHISFSFHDKPELLKEIVDQQIFETVVCQYNLLNTINEDAIAYAKERGLGVFIMGPLAGGNITLADKNFMQKFETDITSPAELGLKFVWGNKNIDCLLSGIDSLKVLEENIQYESRPDLDENQWSSIRQTAENVSDLLEIYCTDCQYCFVCPRNIRPANIFKQYNSWKTWGLKDAALKAYNVMLTNEWWYGNRPDLCTGCGACMKKCPQKLNIPQLLKKVTAEFEQLRVSNR